MKVKHLLHCHLLLSAANLGATPALNALLKGAAPATLVAEDAAGWLCSQFGLSHVQESAIAALGDGLDAHAGHWLHADPVYVHLLRDRILLTDEPFADLTPAEAGALIDSLNLHFAADGLQFFAPQPNRWYLKLQSPADIATVSRSRATGGDVHQYLPQGPAAMVWHQRLNEIQMLLYTHPVNVAREERGAVPVNSVWLAGGGTLPQKLRSPFDGIWAGNALVSGLALVSGCAIEPQPASAGAWLAEASAGAHLIVLDDAADWAQDWLMPLRQALNAGKVGRLTLHLAYPQAVRSITISPADRWKFWRRSPLLGQEVHG